MEYHEVCLLPHFFKNSEFHFLLGSHSEILAVFRLNFDFVLEISGTQYVFAEAVGLVAAHKKKRLWGHAGTEI